MLIFFVNEYLTEREGFPITDTLSRGRARISLHKTVLFNPTPGVALCRTRQGSGPDLYFLSSGRLPLTLKNDIMAFPRKKRQKINGQWYPMSVMIGKSVSTNEVADRLSQISTVSRPILIGRIERHGKCAGGLHGAGPYGENRRAGHVLPRRKHL